MSDKAMSLADARNEAQKATAARKRLTALFDPDSFVEVGALVKNGCDGDVIKAHQFTEQKGAMLIGPNCPGLISPGKSMVGILPGQVFLEGNVGVISRSGTLTYEIVYHLTANGMGQSTACLLYTSRCV